MCDLFFILDKTCFTSHADDNAPYNVQRNTSKVVKSLEEISKPLIEWFKDNEIRLNPDKCHLILSDSDITTINVGNFTIKSINKEKLVRVTLIIQLIFNLTWKFVLLGK